MIDQEAGATLGRARGNSRSDFTGSGGFVCSSFEELEVAVACFGGEGEFCVDLDQGFVTQSELCVEFFEAASNIADADICRLDDSTVAAQIADLLVR